MLDDAHSPQPDDLLALVLEDRAECASQIIAARILAVTIALISAHSVVPADVAAAEAAADNPSPENLRRLRELGRGRAWEPMLLDALAENAIARGLS